MRLHPKNAQGLTSVIAYCIAKDMMPFQMIKRPGFLRMIKVAVPNYKVPTRNYFSKTEHSDVKKSLAQGEFYIATIQTAIQTSGPVIEVVVYRFTVHYLTPA